MVTGEVSVFWWCNLLWRTSLLAIMIFYRLSRLSLPMNWFCLCQTHYNRLHLLGNCVSILRMLNRRIWICFWPQCKYSIAAAAILKVKCGGQVIILQIVSQWTAPITLAVIYCEITYTWVIVHAERQKGIVCLCVWRQTGMKSKSPWFLLPVLVKGIQDL